MVNSEIMAGLTASLVVAGAVGGYRVGRMQSRWWLAAFAVPLGVLVSVATARHFPLLAIHPPLSWLVAGRVEYVLMALTTSMMFATLWPRLKRATLRWLVVVLAVVFILGECVGPFVMPLMLRSTLRQIHTQIDEDGVCRQQTEFTCGAAAAVTALRQLGINAEEGDTAILLQTSPLAGTEPDLAAELLQERYQSQGLRCEYRVFRSAAELPKNTPMLATLKYSALVGHIVAIVRDESGWIIVSDPWSGRRLESIEVFDRDWRGEVVILRRDGHSLGSGRGSP